MKPNVLVLFTTGTNRDHDAAVALELAGASTVVKPLKQLLQDDTDWSAYQMLVIPGGFSYADALGAGKLLALDLKHYFSEKIQAFVQSGKPVIGICNGFQALVKAGILPETNTGMDNPWATLTFNKSGHFECRWVTLKPVSQNCLWTKGLTKLIDCPVAHGEGNFHVNDLKLLQQIKNNDQIALIYSFQDGNPANNNYPENPNGSVFDIAGVCNKSGNVLGLMPHPEDHIFPFQTPDRANRPGYYGLPLFKNGVAYAREM